LAKRDPRVDDYIEKSAEFARPILKHLRRVVHLGCPQVQEMIKWSCPHFDYKGIMCGMAAFKHHYAFGFWKGKLIFESGEHAKREAMRHLGRIPSLSDLPAEKILIDYVRKAAQLNETGVRSPVRSKTKKETPLKIPKYFSAALKQNHEARTTFEDFSPTNQREYVQWVGEAKRDQTRDQRLKTSILCLAEGKPRNWKYMPAWR
jgi:uncharacterized protein YdeI (YjbR/CyaY-like superfamily)